MRIAVVTLCLLAYAARAETFNEPGAHAVAAPAPGTSPSAPTANPMPSASDPVVTPDAPLSFPPPTVVTPTPQIQADLGLTVIMLGYEQPVADQISMQLEVGIMGTYFLPWFDLGDDVKGFGGGVRATWFARPERHGLYVTPYLRFARVSGERETAGMTVEGKGYLVTAGAFAGYAFGLTKKLDLRIGIGAQYIYIDAVSLGASTPFIGLDAIVGYRL